MQDLEVIERLNARAAADDIPTQRRAGKFVVALYSGLNYVSHAVFASVEEARAYGEQRAALNEPGERAQILAPLAATATAQA